MYLVDLYGLKWYNYYVYLRLNVFAGVKIYYDINIQTCRDII